MAMLFLCENVLAILLDNIWFTIKSNEH